jgi:hypothetical protein
MRSVVNAQTIKRPTAVPAAQSPASACAISSTACA